MHGLPGCRLFHRRLCIWTQYADRQLLHRPLLLLAVGSGSTRPAAAPLLPRKGRRIPWADEDVNVDMHMYLFYLPSVLRMVSLDTQRVEIGHTECNSIAKAPLAPSGLEPLEPHRNLGRRGGPSRDLLPYTRALVAFS